MIVFWVHIGALKGLGYWFVGRKGLLSFLDHLSAIVGGPQFQNRIKNQEAFLEIQALQGSPPTRLIGPLFSTKHENYYQCIPTAQTLLFMSSTEVGVVLSCVFLTWGSHSHSRMCATSGIFCQILAGSIFSMTRSKAMVL